MGAFMSLIGWSFLPDIVSSFLQTVYYGITIRAGDPKPAPGSPQYTRHRRRIRLLVLTAYLLYTIYEADHETRRLSSYYADLNVPITATDREIKSRFRRLAAVHHPDKTGSSSEAATESAAYFIHLKLASDTLQDAAKRFAYERFGADITSWAQCVTIRDFVSQGVLYNILPHYALAAAMLYLMGLFGYMDVGRFYRWLILMALCLGEVHAATRAGFSPLLNLVNLLITTLTRRPPYLPFQLAALLRKLTLSMSISLSQIAPLLAPPSSAKTNKPAADEDSPQALRESLAALEGMSKQLDADTGRLMDMEVAPFKGDPAVVNNIRGQMQEWLVQNTIRADPMVKDALKTILKTSRKQLTPAAEDKEDR
ncbi:hypothetical protein E4U43_001201 [Claviceps pusilla]|uniref:J domain-containing protein n=1 Tax=Claviceps pusilla TaxID=123648 RepID=A0A9P7N8X8_9HYPO|nr:hypothetical protein E4U43_001201 [Claviceps pusilla]